MIRLAVSVEGQTEEEFVRTVLAPHLRLGGIEPEPILLGTGRGGRGGNVTVEGLSADMAKLYHTFDAVTSLVDLYGFRGRDGRDADGLEEAVGDAIAQRVQRQWDERRVIPYVQRYEFEGLLFSDVSAFERLAGGQAEAVEALRNIRGQFPTPEDINDQYETAPSRRIMRVIDAYNKRVDGPLLAEDIGLKRIRGECRRFNQWVGHLESLADLRTGRI